MDNQNQALPVRLAERLKDALPGLGSCAEFAPQLCYGRHAGPPACDTKRAAVLILLYPDEDVWRLPLTLRPTTMPSHAGQVSFPGGEIEKHESIEEAALREYREELGEPGRRTEFLGRLSDSYVFASNYLVTPCVAWTAERPAFVPNAAEVARLLEPSLVDLLDSTRYGNHLIHRRGVTFRAPHIRYNDECIWGATVMMIAEFLQVVRDCNPWPHT